MKLRLAVVALLSAAAFAQPSSGELPFVGTIEGMKETEFRLKSGGETITVQTDRNTQVRKNRLARDVSVLAPGNEISARCRKDASGRLTAALIWADVVSFSAAVSKVNSNDFLVSSPRLGSRVVRHYAGTSFSADPKNLSEGQQVFIIGIDIGDSTIDATRVTIYNTDVPVRP